MASGIPRVPEGARGQTGEQGREIEAEKRVYANQLRGHRSIKSIHKSPDLPVNKNNVKATHRMG